MFNNFLLRRALTKLKNMELIIWSLDLRYRRTGEQMTKINKEWKAYLKENQSQAIRSELDKLRFKVLRLFIPLVICFDFFLEFKTFKMFTAGVALPAMLTVLVAVSVGVVIEWGIGIMKIPIRNESDFDSESTIKLKKVLFAIFCCIFCLAVPLATITEMLGEISNLNMLLELDSALTADSIQAKKSGIILKYTVLALASFILHIVCFMGSHKLLTAYTVKAVVKADEAYENDMVELEDKKFPQEEELVHHVVVYDSKVKMTALRFGLQENDIRGKFSPSIQRLFVEVTHQHIPHGATA